jgi:glycosyltransferase involved in cell wall biosynthesis
MGRSRDLNLSDCVRFLGFVVDMDNFYRNIDLFVLTSAWEGCPNVILEAMHQGLPLVAFNNSSLPEIVIDNYNGFLVKNEDERDLAEKVEVLIRDSSLRKKFGEAGRQIVYEKYKLFESYDQLTALINK